MLSRPGEGIKAPVAEIRELYLSGLSTRQIAEVLRWSKSYIHRFCADITRSRRDAAVLRQPSKSTHRRSCRASARAKMERHLGRKLLRSEHVHHKDRDYTNNVLDNLEVKDASEHIREHLALRWEVKRARKA